jgi:murein DD-endopeptidase MepM/ murein hydrolase activator NlpD
MKRLKRFSWTFCLLTKGKVHQVVLRDVHLYLMLGLTALLFLTTSLLTFRGMKTQVLFSEYRERLLVKEQHINSLKWLGDEIRLLEQELERFASFDDKLRYALDVGSIDRKLRIMGIGGPSAIDTLKGRISRSSFALVSEVVRDAYFAEQMVELEQSSYEGVLERVKSIVDLKRHTPSIWPTHGYISSGFGYRRHPIRRSISFHSGIDIANCRGTKVYATACGVVDFAGWQSGYGKFVSIDHGYGIKTKYGHLQKILVEVGQKVRRGELIGTMGSSGVSTGPHLQYEVRILNNPVNPLNYIIRDTLTY